MPIRFIRIIALVLAGAILLTSCGPAPQSTTNVESPDNFATVTATILPPTKTVSPTDTPAATKTPADSPTPGPTPLPEDITLDPEDWMNWPVLPVITQHVLEIYQLGQELGRDPHAFSIFGDCQSVPEEFLGLYKVNQDEFDALPENLQETIDYFAGSINRDSATVKPGTTTGALLWAEWHEGNYGCQIGETPVDCEVRNNNPAFVLITVGTHYDARNRYYMEIILDDLLEQGIVPILSTKADNREGDHRINLQTAQLAVDYNLPMWNFWATTADLPDNGLIYHAGEEFLGRIYFSDEVKVIHRISALEVLDSMWRTVTAASN
ncbi:hypothetical protein KQH54_04125 [bacterium]|nr:hypothetical protein [bacterium]